MTGHIVKTNGLVGGLYPGISAAVLRQATYSTTRFACYETLKDIIIKGSGSKDMPFYQKILCKFDTLFEFEANLIVC